MSIAKAGETIFSSISDKTVAQVKKEKNILPITVRALNTFQA